MHIVEAPGVWLAISTDSVGVAEPRVGRVHIGKGEYAFVFPIVLLRLVGLLDLIEIRFGYVERRVRTGPAGVFPFCLGRQPILVARR